MMKRLKNFQKVFLWGYLAVSGLAFAFFLPPFQKYDETGHFTRAVALSRGQFFCKEGAFWIPKDLEKLYLKYNFEPVLVENKKFPVELINFNEKRGAEKEELTKTAPCAFSFTGYLPNTLGIIFGELSDRLAVIFYAGRLFGLLFFALMLAWSLKIIDQKFRYLLWLYALTPLVVHQVTSYSYDVTVFSLVPLLTALFVNLLAGRRWGWKDWLTLFVSITAISSIRIVYWPLLLLFPLFGWKKKDWRIWVLLVVASLTLSMGISRRSMKDLEYNPYVNPTIQRQLILDDLKYFVRTLFRTIEKNWLDEYKSMVAVFGWKNSGPKSDFVYYVYLLFLIWTIKETAKNWPKELGVDRCFLGLGLVGGIFLAFYLVMYLIWSVVGANIISGTQGRYYLPLLPFGVVMMAGIWFWVRKRPILKWAGLGLAMVLGLLSSVKGLTDKYFDYSKNYINLMALEERVKGLRKQDRLELTEIRGEKPWVIEVDKRNISGFKIVIDSREKPMLAPYKYQIKDGDCRKVLVSGYLGQYEIQGKKIYVEEFRPIRASSNKLCFELEAKTFGLEDYSKDFLWLETANGELLFEWLYFGDGSV